MKCPKCESGNQKGVKFRKECRAKSELVCPSCKKRIPLSKKFCGECDKYLTLPSKHAPQELSQKDQIKGERKQMTIMFRDLENVIPLSELLGMEEANANMDPVYEILIHKAHDFEGTVWRSFPVY